MSVPGKKYLRRINNLGFFNFVRYMAHKKTGLPRSGEFELHSSLATVPLVCRGGSSDIDVFKHIFVLLSASLDVGSEVIQQLARIGKVHRSNVQQAGFLVLKSPDVPDLSDSRSKGSFPPTSLRVSITSDGLSIGTAR